MRSAALSIVMASSQGWMIGRQTVLRAPAPRSVARRSTTARRRGVVLEATPSKSWQRGNALSYASGDVYAKHGLEAVLSHPLLTKEEEFELGSKVQKLSQIEKTRSSLRENCTDASDDSVAKLLGYVDPIDIFRAEVAGRDAREHMILSNMRLVVSTARRAQARLPRATQLAVDRDGGAQALEDLVAEGTLGLATAVDRYDPGRGFRFSTYAVWWVRQAIQKASRKRQIVAVPRHVQELGKQCENATKQLRDMLGRSPCGLRRPATFLRYDAIDATRLHETRPWVVSFSILSAFRARSRLDTYHTQVRRRARGVPGPEAEAGRTSY
jgi:RNA polymerase sigma factor (sigma-70 family)